MISENNFVPKQDIKTFGDIDGLKVIEELLLFKGVDICTTAKSIHDKVNTVPAKMLDDMALITYGLKVNVTNKLYVGFHLDKFYKRNGLVWHTGAQIIVPNDIYQRVNELNESFKNKQK